MGIDIVNQTNEQECGVCVLTSLHNHYYKKELVDKEKVLDKSNITKNGLSIFDFEVSARNLGLECESYEINWSEFLTIKINSYFVLLLVGVDGQSNHYVIAKKRKKYLEIYDSCSDQMHKISYSEIKNRFLNVLILVNKKPNKMFNNVFGKTRTLLMFDLKFVILNIFLSILLLCFSILSASFINWMIDIAIGKHSINNLLAIGFIFIVVYFGNDLLTYITNLYYSSHIKNYFLLFTSKILTSLNLKKQSFLNKVDKTWIYKIDECVYSLANFCVIEINKFISNIIFGVTCICVIGIKQYYLLIFMVVIPLVQLIFFFFAYRKKKEVFINVVRSENKNSHFYKQLIESINFEHWSSKQSNLIKRIKENYSEIYKNFNDVNIFKSNLNLFRSLVKSLIEIVLIMTIGYLIIKDNKLTIGNISFILSTITLYTNSTNGIFEYLLGKVEFNVYWQVYKDLTTVDNLKNDKVIELKDDIKSITFVIDGNQIEFKENQDSIIHTSVIDLLNKSKTILINNIKVNKDNKNVLDNIIVCDEFSCLDLSYFLEIFQTHPEIYSPFLRYFKINLNDTSQSFYKSTILNLLCLINEENKIIFIDSILDFIPQKDKFIVRDIINRIKHKNYLFVTRKEEYD